MDRPIHLATVYGLAMLANCLVASANVAGAQHAPPPVIRGVVVDTGGQPVALARVSAADDRSTVTDSAGAFALRLREKVPRAIDVRRIGYMPVRVSLGVAPDSALRVVLVPASAALDPVRTQAEYTVRSLELRGFYDRLREKERGANTGHFLTPADVERRNTSRITVLVDGIPGVRVLPHKCDKPGGCPALFSNSRCTMTIFLDGTRLNSLNRNRSEPVYIDDIITARDISAVEVYTRSNAPDRYRSLSGSCGVVLLWTK